MKIHFTRRVCTFNFRGQKSDFTKWLHSPSLLHFDVPQERNPAPRYSISGYFLSEFLGLATILSKLQELA